MTECGTLKLYLINGNKRVLEWLSDKLTLTHKKIVTKETRGQFIRCMGQSLKNI